MERFPDTRVPFGIDTVFLHVDCFIRLLTNFPAAVGTELRCGVVQPAVEYQMCDNTNVVPVRQRHLAHEQQ